MSAYALPTARLPGAMRQRLNQRVRLRLSTLVADEGLAGRRHVLKLPLGLPQPVQ